MRKYTIEEGTKGEVAIKNDGTLEQLQELLILMFPKDSYRIESEWFIGNSKFYYLSHLPGKWASGDKTDLPTQSVKDFLIPEWKPERGEMVLVRFSTLNEWGGWCPRIFITEAVGSRQPYITVTERDTDNFRNGLDFDITMWGQMKQLIPEEPRVEVSVMINGEESAMSFAKSEWDKLMKLNARADEDCHS